MHGGVQPRSRSGCSIRGCSMRDGLCCRCGLTVMGRRHAPRGHVPHPHMARAADPTPPECVSGGAVVTLHPPPLALHPGHAFLGAIAGWEGGEKNEEWSKRVKRQRQCFQATARVTHPGAWCGDEVRPPGCCRRHTANDILHAMTCYCTGSRVQHVSLTHDELSCPSRPRLLLYPQHPAIRSATAPQARDACPWRGVQPWKRRICTLLDGRRARQGEFLFRCVPNPHALALRAPGAGALHQTGKRRLGFPSSPSPSTWTVRMMGPIAATTSTGTVE